MCKWMQNKSKSDLFGALADVQKSAYGTIINVYEVRLMIQFRAY